jgi:hypothetical protein
MTDYAAKVSGDIEVGCYALAHAQASASEFPKPNQGGEKVVGRAEEGYPKAYADSDA